MIYNEKVVLYKRKNSTFDPDTGSYKEIIEGEVEVVCQVSFINDNVRDIPEGRITGKTIKVRMLKIPEDFNYAIYRGKEYRKIGQMYNKNRTSVVLEEVVG